MIIANHPDYSRENLRKLSDEHLLQLPVPHDMFDQLRHVQELSHRFGDDYENNNSVDVEPTDEAIALSFNKVLSESFYL